MRRLIRLRREFFKFVLAWWRRQQEGAGAVALIFGVVLSGDGCRGGGGLTELDSKFCDSSYVFVIFVILIFGLLNIFFTCNSSIRTRPVNSAYFKKIVVSFFLYQLLSFFSELSL